MIAGAELQRTSQHQCATGLWQTGEQDGAASGCLLNGCGGQRDSVRLTPGRNGLARLGHDFVDDHLDRSTGLYLHRCHGALEVAALRHGVSGL